MAVKWTTYEGIKKIKMCFFVPTCVHLIYIAEEVFRCSWYAVTS